MKLYEVINPSDAATFYAPNLNVAVVAMLFLDDFRGAYGAEAVDGSESGPILFGVADWLREQGLMKPDADDFVDGWIDEHREQIADALASVALGTPNDRADFDDMRAALADQPEKWAEFIERRNDRRRSSINNFEGYAHHIAERLRKNREPC